MPERLVTDPNYNLEKPINHNAQRLLPPSLY